MRKDDCLSPADVSGMPILPNTWVIRFAGIRLKSCSLMKSDGVAGFSQFDRDRFKTEIIEGWQKYHSRCRYYHEKQ